MRVLVVRNLSVSYAAPGGGRTQVSHDLSLTVAAGEVVALVGESGSGKTTTAQSSLVCWPMARGLRLGQFACWAKRL